MPVRKTKNKDFFKKWSSEMAYILGFFMADGNMIKNKRDAHFIEFTNTDRVILEKIRSHLRSNHKISAKIRNGIRENTYRFQIGSKEIFSDLLSIGMTPNKSKTIALPYVPTEYFGHFVRGYFDGDGCASICTYRKTGRKNASTVINSNFVSGSEELLPMLKERLLKMGIIKGGATYFNKGYRLVFSINDYLSLYRFMYSNVENGLFLARKKKIFEKYFKM